MLVRKTVTALFCDVTDSTGLGERLDPESHRIVIARYFQAMREVIEHHGGTVEKFIGDAVMALFGVPRVREDDALRAVRAAADMRQRVGELNEELEPAHGVRLQVSIGVNTGEVVTGGETVGGTLATGDAITVAARLQQAAGPDEILIGTATHTLVKDAVRTGPRRRFKVKGKRADVATWRLDTVDAGASGFARRLDAALVDREVELRALLDAFDAASAAGECRLVTVLGAAGIGKSRLAGQLLVELGERASALTGRCLPYGEGITFWPIAQIVRSLGGPDALERVLAGAADRDAIADRVRRAVGSEPAAIAAAESFWGLRRLLEELARMRPLVLCVEDVHWAEPTLLDLVEYVHGLSQGAPILIVCLARPDLLEMRPTWLTPRERADLISLEPLGPADADALVDVLRGDTELPASARRRIAEAAEGNPLFVEQLVALASEDGADERDAVPPSIQALLGERLDRLEPDERAIIERAAIVGREFTLGQLVHLTEDELRPAVTGSLLSLARKGLLAPGGEEGTDDADDAYRFRHVLIRDAAYDAVPRELSALLHERVAAWIAALPAARAAELEEVAGYHLEQAHAARTALGRLDAETAQLAVRAAVKLSEAGRRALARGDAPAAASLLTRGAVLLRDDDARRLELAPQLALALLDTGELARAGRVLESALEAAKTLCDDQACARLSVDLVGVQLHTDPEAWEGALDAAEAAIAALEAAGDDAGLARAWTIAMLAHYVRGQLELMEDAAERAADHAERADDERSRATVLDARLRSALLGRTPAGEAIERCRAVAAELRGDRRLQAVATSAVAVLEAMRGNTESARDLYRDAHAVLQDLGLVRVLAALRAYSAAVELLAGDPESAADELRNGLAVLEASGDRGNISTHAGLLARALLEAGHEEEAVEASALSEATAGPNDVHSQIDWRAARARLLARRDAVPEALELAREAVRIANGTDLVDRQGGALMALAEVLAAAGDSREAAATLAAAADRFAAKGNVVSEAEARGRLEAVGRVDVDVGSA